MQSLRYYINLLEALSAPKYLIQYQGQDSSVLNVSTGEIEYAGSVAECRMWVKQRDPQGHYTFEEDQKVTYAPTGNQQLTPQEQAARLAQLNQARAASGQQQRDQRAWQQQQDQFKDLYAKNTR